MQLLSDLQSKLRAVFISFVLLTAIQACSTLDTPLIDTELLLSGERVFQHSPLIGANELKLDDIMALDTEMREWVAATIADTPYDGSKLKKLIVAMIESGLLDLDYESTANTTAIDTFHNKTGNCLSFSILFTALARKAGLEANFQLVQVPPIYSSNNDLVMLNNHINVVVDGIQEGANFTRRQVVDFNTADYGGDYEMRRVPDDYVLALFQNNLAVEAISDGSMSLAFAHLSQAIANEPDIPELWVNLGVFYARHAQYDLAIQSYNQALTVRSSYRPAMTNLANLYQLTGEFELAAKFRKRVAHYQNLNPYYHFSLAREAYEKSEYELALEELRKAISRKDDEHQFYYLQGLTRLQLADAEGAARSFKLAREATQREDLIKAYNHKLERLQLATYL